LIQAKTKSGTIRKTEIRRETQRMSEIIQSLNRLKNR